MVLAAGFGQRMRPLTDNMPKPLVKVAGSALLDHVLDRLADAGVERAIVNVHYLAEQIEAHVASRTRPKVTISDERGVLLDTGGGVVEGAAAARPRAVFPHQFRHDLDRQRQAEPDAAGRTFRRRDHGRAPAARADSAGSIGYDGRGDFSFAADGRLMARTEREIAPFVYAGAAILSPRLFEDAPKGAFSLTKLFARAAEQGRLHGLRLEGLWMHVGTPDAIGKAEAAILASTA